MSSPEEASVPGTDFFVEAEEQPKSLSVIPGPPESHEGEDSLSGPNGTETPLVSQLEVTEGRTVVLWARENWSDSPVDEEGRPGSPVDEIGVSLDFLPHVRVETLPIEQMTSLETDPETPDTGEHPSSESVCSDAEAGPSRRGLEATSCEEAKLASAALLYPKGPEQGRAWVTPRRSTASRVMVSKDAQCPSSEPETSDEFDEAQMMRVTICLKDGGQAKSSSLVEAGGLNRPSNVQITDSLVRMPSSLVASPSWALTSGVERQASKELEAFPPKKKQGVEGSKGGGKPSYAEAAAAGAAGLPKASPRKKVVQKRKTLWDASAVTRGRAFHHWGQRLTSAPVEPATFPRHLGVGLSGRSNKCSLMPLRPKQCKNCYTGKRSGAKRTREFQPVTREDTDTTRDPSSQAQLPKHRADPPSQNVLQGEFSGGDPNTRGSQDPGNSLALSQRNIASRSAPSGDQEPPVGPPDPEPEMQQLPETQGCPRCPELQKDIEDLKKQLAAMRSLNEKFQALSS
ncbi:uncharacterized protein CXorf49 homolog [Nannospalax galili]|uniref:uncharacterized protein CXorf49 homolog n=1 Tax=Nannospalax galili TaxID=1026970 RepID=UPI0004ED3070|nr:uncharacterized protein CXorf49 homolog [Nannospalax galili]